MDTKTYRLLAEREACEEQAEYEAAYMEYDGIPIPTEEPS